MIPPTLVMTYNTAGAINFIYLFANFYPSNLASKALLVAHNLKLHNT